MSPPNQSEKRVFKSTPVPSLIALPQALSHLLRSLPLSSVRHLCGFRSGPRLLHLFVKSVFCAVFLQHSRDAGKPPPSRHSESVVLQLSGPGVGVGLEDETRWSGSAEATFPFHSLQLSDELKQHLARTLAENYRQPGAADITTSVDRLQQDVSTRPGGMQTWVQIPTLSLPVCVTLDRLLTFSELQLPPK